MKKRETENSDHHCDKNCVSLAASAAAVSLEHLAKQTKACFHSKHTNVDQKTDLIASFEKKTALWRSGNKIFHLLVYLVNQTCC